MRKESRKRIKRAVMITAVLVSVFTCWVTMPVYAKKSVSAPAKVVIKTVNSPSKGKLKITWKKVSKAAGYQVQAAQNKTFTKKKLSRTVSVKSSSFTASKLALGKKYYVRVRAYKKVNGNKKYGKWSIVKSVSVKRAVPQAVIRTISSPDKGRLKTVWRKVSGINGYQVQTAQDTGFKKNMQSRQAAAGSTSLTVSGLVQGKKYYVRVRAYRNVSGTKEKEYGRWSGTKSITVKKGIEITDLSKLGVTVKVKQTAWGYSYTGEAVEPEVSVYHNTLSFMRDIDYKVSYMNNINAGTATVVVEGIGKYTGSVTQDFEIGKASSIPPKVSISNETICIGRTEKIDVSEAYGSLTFHTSREGVLTIDSDGTITPLSSGTVVVRLDVSGDDNHEGYKNYNLGRLTVIHEEASAYGFDSIGSSDKTYKSEKVYSRESDGSNTFGIYFFCNSNEKWLDEQTAFEVEDVTPKAYTTVFNNMGVPYVSPQIAVDSAADYISEHEVNEYMLDGIVISEPYTADGPGERDEIATSGKFITVDAGAGVRAVKLTAKRGSEVLDYVYLVSNGYERENKKEYSTFDLDLYKQVRERVEEKIWTDDMSNIEKIQTLAQYINETTHYPRTAVTSKEYNPAFWNDWAVDDKVLLYDFSDVILNRIMDLQGGIVTCQAADILERAAVEDLGLPYLYDSSTGEIALGEGVWRVSGSYSSNPDNPYHESLKYKYPDESTVLVDAQGMDYDAGSEKVTCEGHDCKSRLVSLN